MTCAVATESGKYLFTSGKDGSITKWDLVSAKKLAMFPAQNKIKGKGKAPAIDIRGHTDQVLALALSGDGRYLASGGKDRRLIIWDVESNQLVKGFSGPLCHKDSISVRLFLSF